MGLSFSSYDNADDENAFDLREQDQSSNQSGVNIASKNIKSEPRFFDGTSTAIQRGAKAGLNKVALSLFGTEQENLDTIKIDPLQKQLYEEAKRQRKIGTNVTVEQYISQSYKDTKKQTMQTIANNSPNETDGMGAQVLNSLSDYGARGIVGGSILGGAYVVGTSTHDYTYNKLIASGVDKSTAKKAALNDGVADAIGMAVPIYRGVGMVKNAGLIAAPVAVIEGGRAVNNTILDNEGYDQQAKQYEFSMESVLTGLVLGATINRGTAYFENRKVKSREQTPEQVQETGEIKDELTTDISQRVNEDFDHSTNTHHANDVVANEQNKQNKNAVENQITNGQKINVPHPNVPEPKSKATGSKVASYTGKPWAKKIAIEAEKRGIDPIDAVVISHLETGGTFNPNIQPRDKNGKILSSAKGLYQTLDGTFDRMGSGDRWNGDNQINAGLNYYKHNAAIFQKKFGRNPIGLELYYMHFFGEGGGPQFLKAGDNELFLDVATRWSKPYKNKTTGKMVTAAQQGKSISKSHGFEGMTVGDVKSKYQKKWDSVAKQYGGGSGENRISTAFHSDKTYDTMTDIVDLNDLVVSNDIDGALNALYPQELQPRDRTREASRQQIEDMANDIKPEWLGESHKLSDGAPIIGRDYIVESGNGRTLAISKALQDERGNGYRDYVKDYANKNGIDIEGINNPILVRRRLTDTDRVEFTRLANESDVSQFSATERAVTDADRLPDSSLLKTNTDGSINVNQSMDYVRQFMDQVPHAERSVLMDGKGGLSQEGKRRIESAIVQRTYGDSNLVKRLSENLDDDSKTVLNALLRAAPQLSQLNDLVRQGGRHQNSISNDLAQAVQKYSDLKSSGLAVKDYLQQGQLLDDGLSTGAKDFLNVFDSNNRSAKAISDHIQSKIDEVEAKGDPRQGQLFGNTPEQELALKIMQDNPEMEISAIFEDASGNQIEVNSVGNLIEQIEKDSALSRMEETATQAAISCALQFG